MPHDIYNKKKKLCVCIKCGVVVAPGSSCWKGFYKKKKNLKVSNERIKIGKDGWDI